MNNDDGDEEEEPLEIDGPCCLEIIVNTTIVVQNDDVAWSLQFALHRQVSFAVPRVAPAHTTSNITK